MSKLSGKVRVARLAGRQFGRVRWSQMAELGIADSTINGWTGEGYLAPLSLPGVYAVGHRAPSVEAELSEALLYAGAVPGAGCTSMAAATSRVPGIATCR